jgi:phage I-like protein
LGKKFVQLDGFNLPLDAAGNPPSEFLIFAAGKTTTQKGTYVYDEEAASSVRTAEEDKRRKPWMDYEHQSLHKPPIEAPAAAFYDLEYRPDGLYATNVKWRPRAAQYLKAGEYAFHSPAFWQDEETGRVLELINDALTNDPATHDAKSLVPLKASLPAPDLDDVAESSRRRLTALSAAKPDEEKHMSKAILVALGCKDDADESAGIAAATQLSDLKREVMSLTGKMTLSEAVGALHAFRSASEQVVALSARAEAAEKKLLKADVEKLVDAAARDGKVPPAKRDDFVALGERDMVALKTTLDLLPVLPGQGAPAKPADVAPAVVALTADEERIARMFGNDPAKLREHKAQMLKASAQPTEE